MLLPNKNSLVKTATFWNLGVILSVPNSLILIPLQDFRMQKSERKWRQQDTGHRILNFDLKSITGVL